MTRCCSLELRGDVARNSAYLSLDDGAAVANRLVFTEEDDRPAWGINLDFDPAEHLVGVEFEHADRQLPEGGVEHTLPFATEERASPGASTSTSLPTAGSSVSSSSPATWLREP